MVIVSESMFVIKTGPWKLLSIPIVALAHWLMLSLIFNQQGDVLFYILFLFYVRSPKEVYIYPEFMALLHQWLSIWDDWLRYKSQHIYHCPVLSVNGSNATGRKSGQLIAQLLSQMPQAFVSFLHLGCRGWVSGLSTVAVTVAMMTSNNLGKKDMRQTFKIF